MPLAADLLDRKRTQFLSWHPKPGATAGPVMVIGQFQAGNPSTLATEQRFALSPVATDASNPAAVYVVPNFPPAPPGREWREVTQQRSVPAEWIGREPIFPWEAKVYTLI